jgi:hypothetical protein
MKKSTCKWELRRLQKILQAAVKSQRYTMVKSSSSWISIISSWIVMQCLDENPGDLEIGRVLTAEQYISYCTFLIENDIM